MCIQYQLPESLPEMDDCISHPVPKQYNVSKENKKPELKCYQTK